MMGVSVEIYRAAKGFFNSYIQANFRVATIFLIIVFFHIVVFVDRIVLVCLIIYSSNP